MITFHLRRDLATTDETLGVLTVLERKFQSIERPWVPASGYAAGIPFMSCVPPGTYRLERHEQPSGERVLIMSNPQLNVYQSPDDVPSEKRLSARTCCFIQAANWAYQLNGCVAPGKERIRKPKRWMLSESRSAMNEIRTLIHSDLDLVLTIA